MRLPEVATVLEPLLERGMVATCAILDLEALYSAQSLEEYRREERYRAAVLEYVDTEERDLDRALELQAGLAEKSMHRAASLPDLIIAAVAERHALIVMHYDSDYEYIAQVGRFQSEWVVERGTIA
jgi:predicted nucleic acid-binding protein